MSCGRNFQLKAKKEFFNYLSAIYGQPNSQPMPISNPYILLITTSV